MINFNSSIVAPFSIKEPTTIKSAPAAAIFFACDGRVIPPPTISGMSKISETCLTTEVDAWLTAPLPHSKKINLCQSIPRIDNFASYNYQWVFTNTIAWAKTFGVHQIEALAGIEAIEQFGEYFGACHH